MGILCLNLVYAFLKFCVFHSFYVYSRSITNAFLQYTASISGGYKLRSVCMSSLQMLTMMHRFDASLVSKDIH